MIKRLRKNKAKYDFRFHLILSKTCSNKLHDKNFGILIIFFARILFISRNVYLKKAN